MWHDLTFKLINTIIFDSKYTKIVTMGFLSTTQIISIL